MSSSPVLLLQVIAGKVLAAEALEGRVLLLAGLIHGIDGLKEHRVVRLEVSQTVANLLRHTVVVLSVASLYESGGKAHPSPPQGRDVENLCG